jgi:DNA-binding PadR family transcriptional regulator
MFRHSYPYFPMPAWAGEGFCGQFFASDRSRHRGSMGGGWGEEPRNRRGDIKFILLRLLSEKPQHGYELIKELETRRGGFYRLSPGSVKSEQIDGKRVYTITESGRQLMKERPQRHDSASKPSELIELRRNLTEVNDAVTQFARSGNLEQANQVHDLLTHVKREIYKLLAEI